MSSEPQTLSIPSLLVLAALSLLAIRYFFTSSASSSRPPSSRPPSSPRTVNAADVETIATMFPQIARRDIIWDLQRNGGSVPATTERILARGALDTPPPTFQPPLANPPSSSSSPPNPPATNRSNTPQSHHIDLIKRYNLESKLSSPPTPQPQPQPQPGDPNTQKNVTQTWSANKNERQALLQRRREEMVLNARRKIEELEREKGRKKMNG